MINSTDISDTVVAWVLRPDVPSTSNSNNNCSNDVFSRFANLDCSNSSSSRGGSGNNNNAELVASEGLYNGLNTTDDLNNIVGGAGDRNDGLMTADGDPDDVLMAVDDTNHEANEAFNGLTIAERRAAKRGKLVLEEKDVPNTTCTPCYITIPSGISPGTLLDSPIMLPNSQSSPTTGSFATPPIRDMLDSNPDISPSSPPALRNTGSVSELRARLASNSHSSPCSERQVSSSGNRDRGKGVYRDYSTIPVRQPKPTPTEFVRQPAIKTECPETYTADDPYMDANIATAHPLNANTTGIIPRTPWLSAEMARAVEDGYNWRKYGQKQVKGSEYPRSYYRCTHPSCEMRKKVERSHDSHVTEIIYTGRHNHPKPPRQPSIPGTVFPHNEMARMGENSEYCVQTEGEPYLWRNNFQLGSSSSAFVERSSALDGYGYDHNDGHDDDDRARHIYNSTTYDADTDVDSGDDDESESRKRKRENCFPEPSMAPRSAREPRVILEMESEVDIVEDGYRWRKYGQKVVKRNPNPRSYYKCTSTGCTVRKHVERASHDFKRVIMTYEGKHKHDVPAARNIGQVNTGSSYLLPPSTPQSSRRQFDGHEPDISNHIILGNYRSDTRFGSSSAYPGNYLPLPNPIPYYNPPGMIQNHIGMNNTELMVTGIPGLPLPIPYDMNGPEYFGQQDITSQTQTYLAGQQVCVSDMMFMKPEEEYNDDHSYR